MIDNPVHGGIIGDEGDDLHRASALRTDQQSIFGRSLFVGIYVPFF